MQFSVTIRKEGKTDEVRTMEAPNRFAVYDVVRNDGGTVVSIKEANGGVRMPAWLNMQFGTGIKRANLIRTARNLAAMLTAGLPLSRALSVLERQSTNKYLKTVIASISDSVKKGSSFNQALAEHPKVFSPLFIAMAKAGEESGSLPDSLSVVSLQMERTDELIKKIRGAMIYPTIVMIAIVIVFILMLVFVVPTLTKTFQELGVKLPLATRIIVAVSNFMVANLIAVVLGLILAVFGLIFFLRSRQGSATVLWTALHMPVVGELVRETYAARASRTLSSLLSSGVPVLDALDISKEVVRAPIFANVISEAEAHVKKGEPMSAAFADHTKLYPVLMTDMLAVGEETGKVADMLKQIAEFYENDVAERTKDLSTIVEPVLMLIIGTVVGIFAVSMIGPIYSLSSAF